MQHEKRGVFSLSLIMAFRMLGLFMILPVFATAARSYAGSTETLIGVALGVYGLTQALLQIPFGSLSDKIGRKPVILIGLLLFAIGSVVAALSHSMTGVIVGRALQGGGAIGATTMAFVADLTRDEFRSKAMAVIGMVIGFSFMIAMILGPILNTWVHLSGIFWLTAALAVLGIVLLYVLVPAAPKVVSLKETQDGGIKSALKNPSLLRLNFSILASHGTMTAMFLAVPVILQKILYLTEGQEILLYASALILAFILMVPGIIIGEKKRKLKQVIIIAVSLIVLTQLGLWFAHGSVWVVSVLLLVFFTAFTFLEASLPSLVSKVAPIKNKGAAMGVYSACQFFGIFLGGALGGWLYAHDGFSGLFGLTLVLGVLWWLVTITMAEPPYWSTVIVPMSDVATGAEQHLHGLAGVKDILANQAEGLLYVKIDKQEITAEQLRKAVQSSNL